MKVSVYFNNQRRKQDGSIPISLCVTRPPQRFYLSTGLYSSVIFDGETFPRSERNFRAKTIRLNEMIDIAEKILIANSLAPIEDIKKKIKEGILGEQAVEKEKLLCDYIEIFIATKTGNTKSCYITLLNRVRNYDPNAPLDIDKKWINDFCDSFGNNLQHNSKISYLVLLRSVINWCIRNEYTTNYPFKSFHLQMQQTRKRNVSIEVIKKIKDTPVSKKMQKYKDLFLLTFYLIGINTKDLLLAKPDQIVGNRLEYIRYKTKKPYSIKIEPEAMEIIEKYRGTEHLLNICDHREFRSARVCFIFCLKKYFNLTPYYARHSWATIAYNDADIPKDIISQALGHSMGCSTTEIYIERDYKKIDSANRKVLDLLK